MRLLLPLLLLFLVTCTSGTLDTPSRLRTYLRVVNNNWLEQVVYANCGSRIRIGVARGINETLLRIPEECVGREVFITTDPIGSSEISKSDALAVERGDVLDVVVPAIYNGYLFLSR